VLAAAALYAVLWMFLRDGTASLQGQFGELVGAEAVLSMTVSAVLAVGSPRVDALFGGPGRRQRWHRATALIGLALVIAHLPIVVDNNEDPVGVILAVVSLLLFAVLTGLAVLTPGGVFGHWRGPLGWLARLRYDRWKAIHRLTAGALLAGMGHGMLDSSALRHRPVLAVLYLAICLVGAAALAYQLILRRSVLRGSEHRVQDVRQVAADVRVITMRPMGEPWAPAPGQYVDVEFAGIRHGAHPFTVVSSGPDGTVQIAVKANGNDTMAIHEKIGTGARAWIQEPRGDFHHEHLDERQIWIAAGIGITPFLSWIRSLSEDHEGVVDLWYSVRSLTEAPFLEEITAAARAFPWLRLHLVVTQRDGRLTAQRVLAEGTVGRDASAFLCGPPAMLHTFTRDLRALGLTGSIHHEAFSPR
jgi:predicted ferric reductase